MGAPRPLCRWRSDGRGERVAGAGRGPSDQPVPVLWASLPSLGAGGRAARCHREAGSCGAPLPWPTTVVVVVAADDAAAAADGGASFELTTPPLHVQSAPARTWLFRCSASGGAARWVDRLRPWLVSWSALARAAPPPGAASATGAASVELVAPPRNSEWAASRAPSALPPASVVARAVACGQVALQGAGEALRVTSEGIRGLGNILDQTGLVRVGEAIPLAAPLMLCLTAACTVTAAVAAEKAALAPGLAAAKRQAELCLGALGLAAALLPTDDFVVGRLEGLLMELEEAVARLHHYHVAGCLQRLRLFADLKGLPRRVALELKGLRGELALVINFATLASLVNILSGPAYAVSPTVVSSGGAVVRPHQRPSEASAVEVAAPACAAHVPASTDASDGHVSSEAAATGEEGAAAEGLQPPQLDVALLLDASAAAGSPPDGPMTVPWPGEPLEGRMATPEELPPPSMLGLSSPLSISQAAPEPLLSPLGLHVSDGAETPGRRRPAGAAPLRSAGRFRMQLPRRRANEQRRMASMVLRPNMPPWPPAALFPAPPRPAAAAPLLPAAAARDLLEIYTAAAAAGNASAAANVDAYHQLGLGGGLDRLR